MNDAIKLNNEAIDLLMSSCDEAAIDQGINLFTKALKSLKQLVVVSEDEEQASNDIQGSSPKIGSRSLASIIESPCMACHQGRQLHQHSSSQQYIYRRMFRLLPIDCPISSMPNGIQVYIACVIFNSALLHQQHAFGMEPGKTRRCWLEKSALLYHSCFQVLPKFIPSTKGMMTCDEVTFLLKIGSLNNSAQILYECDEFEQASDRFEMIETILCAQGLVETQCCFTDQEFEGILANVLLLKPPTVAVAA